jgi:capsid protein
MISANEIQALLLGSGGFIGTCMAGIGAYRLFSAATRGAMRVPTSLEKTAECLERVVQAVETQNLVSEQVMELKGLLMTTREEILKMGNERELIGRELRLMSRKIEGISLYAQDDPVSTR